MRLLSIELSGFRGFPQQQALDLDADAVVVVGANGNGKTSLFDGVLWALSGRIPRLQNDDARLVSKYSETGQARVELRFEDPQAGRQFTVTRSFDGKEARLALETPEGAYQGPSAEGRLIDLVWPDAASASDPREALASVLARSVYLQQDLIRQFVEAATDHERFAAVSELVGAGRVTELQGGLERAKKAWSTATHQRQDELRPLRERLGVIEARLAELTGRASQALPTATSESWGQWWQNLSALGLKAVPVEATSREASGAIDSAIKQLEALRRSTDRRRQAFSAAQSEIAGLVTRPIPEVPPLRDKATALRKNAEDQKRVVSEEQARLVELRREQAALKEKGEQVRALAALALKLLEDRCPVCGQTYDKDATRIRLLALVQTGGSQAAPGPDNLTELLAALAAKEKDAAAADLSLRSAEQAATERSKSEESLAKRLSELGVVADGHAGRDAALAKAIDDADALTKRAAELQRVGELLALGLAQSSAVATIDELRREAETLRRDNAAREKVISARNDTGERAQAVIEALREAASAVVEERLREIGPLLQGVYARIDPHPSFRFVSFLSRVVRGKGQLSTVVSDPLAEKECDLPASILSSSQVNALAVSVFLALNLGVPKPPLSVAMLDDPLQSLDDINLLSLVDLLRRTKDRRQLFVSTHDRRFGDLLSRKLRPSNEKGRTIVIELDGWSRKGPIVVTRDVRCDPVPLRLVSSRAG
jgi:DNA repair exonuclease SbcCD ATPase subunit